MRKAERLFQLVNLLRGRKPVTAQTLAEELSVSVRSIYRYIDDLSVSGIPVYGEAGVGYRLREHFELPPLNLTEQEFQALLLGVEMVSVSTGRQLPRAAKSLRTKIATALPQAGQLIEDQRIRALDLRDQATHSALWDSLSDAVSHRRVIAFDYLSLADAQSQRRVHPLGLFYWGGKWTLAAWCCLREDYREFRIDRISHLDVLSETFEARPDISLATYLQFQERQYREKHVPSGSESTDTRVSGAPE